MSEIVEQAQAEAERRWPRKRLRRIGGASPSDWLNEGMADGFVLGAQWAAAQRPANDADRACPKCGERCSVNACECTRECLRVRVP